MRTAVVFLVAVLGIATCASAQPCTGVTDSSRTKILLDDIVSTSNTQNLLQSLTSRLEANLAQIEAELGVDLKVFPCEKRRPSGPSDFNREAVQQLSLRGVVMEVWGATAEVKDEKGQPLNEASVGYVIVPVRLDEFQSPVAPGAFVIAETGRPSTVLDDLIRLVDQAGRLGAYASLAVGSKSLRGRSWDDARKQLCAAALQFTRLKNSKPQDAALGKYAQQLAADAVTEARKDKSYNGALKLALVTSSCS
jgi:hypothetical protein